MGPMGAADNPQTDHTASLAFIQRWQNTMASELSTAQSFVRELCDLLGVEPPHATPEQHYMFERPITFQHGDGSTSAGRIDCYRRGAFVLEAKKLKAGAQAKGFDDALLRARSQAESYARALPAGRAARPSCWWWTSAMSSKSTPSSRAAAPPTRPSLTHAATASLWVT
jgi:hypothetical protein